MRISAKRKLEVESNRDYNKNIFKGIHNRLDHTEEQISNAGDRVFESTQAEQKKKKKRKENSSF